MHSNFCSSEWRQCKGPFLCIVWFHLKPTRPSSKRGDACVPQVERDHASLSALRHRMLPWPHPPRPSEWWQCRTHAIHHPPAIPPAAFSFALSSCHLVTPCYFDCTTKCELHEPETADEEQLRASGNPGSVQSVCSMQRLVPEQNPIPAR